MRRFLVSSFLGEITQQIHSLRAKGVMLAHTALTFLSDSIALRKSKGNEWGNFFFVFGAFMYIP